MDARFTSAVINEKYAANIFFHFNNILILILLTVTVYLCTLVAIYVFSAGTTPIVSLESFVKDNVIKTHRWKLLTNSIELEISALSWEYLKAKNAQALTFFISSR